jgi:XFP N-terminal domain
MSETLSKEQLTLMDAYWRAANYLSVGQIYLYDNPMLKKPPSTKQENIFLRLGAPLCYPIFVSFATFVMRKGEISCRA